MRVPRCFVLGLPAMIVRSRHAAERAENTELLEVFSDSLFSVISAVQARQPQSTRRPRSS
jgi:hypothetical protein